MRDLAKFVVATLIVIALLITVAVSTAAVRPVTGEIQRFNVTATNAGANEILAGVAGQQFQILTITITSCSSTSDTFYLYSGDTELWYSAAVPKSIDQGGVSGYQGISLFPFPGGHFLTEAGEDFSINLTAGENVNVMGTYMVVK